MAPNTEPNAKTQTMHKLLKSAALLIAWLAITAWQSIFIGAWINPLDLYALNSVSATLYIAVAVAIFGTIARAIRAMKTGGWVSILFGTAPWGILILLAISLQHFILKQIPPMPSESMGAVTTTPPFHVVVLVVAIGLGVYLIAQPWIQWTRPANQPPSKDQSSEPAPS